MAHEAHWCSWCSEDLASFEVSGDVVGQVGEKVCLNCLAPMIINVAARPGDTVTVKLLGQRTRHNVAYVVEDDQCKLWTPGVGVPFQGEIVATAIGDEEPDGDELAAIVRETVRTDAFDYALERLACPDHNAGTGQSCGDYPPELQQAAGHDGPTVCDDRLQRAEAIFHGEEERTEKGREIAMKHVRRLANHRDVTVDVHRHPDGMEVTFTGEVHHAELAEDELRREHGITFDTEGDQRTRTWYLDLSLRALEDDIHATD